MQREIASAELSLRDEKTVLSSGMVQTEQGYRTGDTETKKLYLAVKLYKLNKAIALVIETKTLYLAVKLYKLNKAIALVIETKKLYLAVKLYKLNKAIAQVIQRRKNCT